MDIKSIVYLGDFTNLLMPDKDILFSLKKIAKVKKIDIRNFDLHKAMGDILNCDLFLFHGQMGKFDKATYYFVLERLKVLLQGTKAKKVLWLFEKIWMDKINIILEFFNSVDYIFVSDETWLKRFETNKIFSLHPAALDKKMRGKFKEENACDIAIFGEAYGNRVKEIEFLKNKFGGRVKVFNNKFDKDLASLCRSAKVIVVPRYPFDDFFWSDRIYKILGYGGFVLHPRAYGLEEQGFKEGVHYMTYNTEQELFVTLDMLLDKKADKFRKTIAKNGQDFVLANHTYRNRISQILEKLQ